jgi:amidase
MRAIVVRGNLRHHLGHITSSRSRAGTGEVDRTVRARSGRVSASGANCIHARPAAICVCRNVMLLSEAGPLPDENWAPPRIVSRVIRSLAPAAGCTVIGASVRAPAPAGALAAPGPSWPVAAGGSQMAIDYPTAGAGALAGALAVGEVSATRLCETAIARIEAMDGAINAVVVRDFDRARDAARAADAALARGERAPLLGVPVTVKESFDVPGLATSWGLAPFRDWRPQREAAVVARLRAAGAVILGKTNVPPNLGDFQTANPIHGRTSHPRDLSRTPGGSSGGGAAAVAAGYVPLEVGSDLGGSIRIPAHFCGVFGHKPSHGLVPMTGHAPPGLPRPGRAPELVVVGPLARTAADLDLALSVLAGPEGDEARAWRLSLPPPRAVRAEDARILVLARHPLAEVDDEVALVLEDAADRLGRAGAQVVSRHPRLPDLVAGHEAYRSMILALISRGAPDMAAPISAHDWMDALDAQFAARRAWSALFEEVDAVLTVPYGVAAFPHDPNPDPFARTLTLNGRPTRYFDQVAWSVIATWPGLPATVAPAGATRAGLPVGVQIIGPWLEDRTTIALAGLVGAAQA